MFAVNQHYQAGPAVVTTTANGWQWDGSNWVPATASTTGGHSTYSTQAYSFQPQQQQQQQQVYTPVAAPAPAAVAATPNLVQQYTQYYHQWKAQADEAEQRAQNLPVGSTERADVQRHADWAKYYADQSSRAAHHYHSAPNQAPPFELPPAPHAMNSSSISSATAAVAQPATTTTTAPAAQQTIAAKKRSRWDEHHRQQQQQQVPAPPQASTAPAAADAGPPDGLKRYVHRCLQQCTTTEQKLAVQHETEKVIARALQQGTLHTTNWDLVELIELNNPQLPKHKKQKQQQHQSKYNKRNSNDSASQASWGSGQDYMALPNNTPNRKKKQQQRQQKPQKGSSKSKGGDGFQRNSKALAERANRFAGAGGMAEAAQTHQATGTDDRYMGKGVIGGSQKKLDETDYEHMKVKGTCQTLEKQYLRLTAPPRPELVRPLEILQKHMKNLKEAWKNKRKRRDYNWFCSELKAVRQDLTVQHIFSPFTVDVYETHARMALQEQDLNEFNQAQTQLKILYGKLDDTKALENLNEFVAYRMIYFVMMTMNKKYNGGSADMLNLMLSLTPSQREDPAIKHALKVRAAVADVNYHQFFRLREHCPNLGGKLMDLMVPTMRHWTLLRICKVYKPTVEVAFVLQELGFPTGTSKDLEEGTRFLSSCGCIVSEDNTTINTKDSVVRESDLQEKQSLI